MLAPLLRRPVRPAHGRQSTTLWARGNSLASRRQSPSGATFHSRDEALERCPLVCRARVNVTPALRYQKPPRVVPRPRPTSGTGLIIAVVVDGTRKTSTEEAPRATAGAPPAGPRLEVSVSGTARRPTRRSPRRCRRARRGAPFGFAQGVPSGVEGRRSPRAWRALRLGSGHPERCRGGGHLGREVQVTQDARDHRGLVVPARRRRRARPHGDRIPPGGRDSARWAGRRPALPGGRHWTGRVAGRSIPFWRGAKAPLEPTPTASRAREGATPGHRGLGSAAGAPCNLVEGGRSLPRLTHGTGPVRPGLWLRWGEISQNQAANHAARVRRPLARADRS